MEDMIAFVFLFVFGLVLISLRTRFRFKVRPDDSRPKQEPNDGGGQ